MSDKLDYIFGSNSSVSKPRFLPSPEFARACEQEAERARLSIHQRSVQRSATTPPPQTSKLTTAQEQDQMYRQRYANTWHGPNPW